MKNASWIVIGALVLLTVGAIVILSMNPVSLNRPLGSIQTISNGSGTSTGTPSALPVLADRMPEFRGITNWWNTEDGQPLTPEKLKGKVVLVDFWTYSCINCIRTQPVLKKFWETYKDDGLVIVGVHTPEFAFEKVPENVETAFKKAGLTYPIALDPNYDTWTDYKNHYWPAGYFFDRQGRLRFTHFGEGNYDEQERVIRELLAEGKALTDTPTGADSSPNFRMTVTRETYFGWSRFEHFVNLPEYMSDESKAYELKATSADEWSIGGMWKITKERAESLLAGNRFRMNVESNAMHLVLGSMDGGTKRIKVSADGNVVGTVDVGPRQLYTVARFPNGGRHTVDIEILDPGVEFYAVTFGE